MVRHWPVNNIHDVLITFNNNTRVESLTECDYNGVKTDKRNDVYSKRFTLLGPYIISNWSDEE